jgi:preprotein translocase subunit SecD
VKRLRWRLAIVGLLVFFAFLYLFPTLSRELPGWWWSFLPQDKIHLGLDLQGGVHLILEVEVNKSIESHLERVVEDLRHDLRRTRIRYADIRRVGIQGVELAFMREEDREEIEKLVTVNYPDYRLEPGKSGETSILLLLDPKAKEHFMRMAADQALETIRNRVDQFGVSEPDIRPLPPHRIQIQLPGIRDPKRAIELIGKTALLEFKLVDEEGSLEEALRGNIPPGSEILYQSTFDPQTGRRTSVPYLLKRRAVLSGDSLTDARVQIDTQYGDPYVSISFDARGARVFERITGENVGKRLAIVLDDNVYSAPVIRDKISGGKAQVTGHFTMNEAKDLAIVLRAGALPAPVNILEERTIGPSLGKDSIRKGFQSMVVGGVFVLLFVAFYYKTSGLIANLALLFNLPLMMAGLAFFGATLTLPGIAGIILTIGMAVDANVLIFERIREELRLGKPARAAIETGYSRAMVTILDSNVTTFIAALVLFQFGTGPIKGFAVTLSIGLLASFYTAVFFTRIIFDYLYI